MIGKKKILKFLDCLSIHEEKIQNFFGTLVMFVLVGGIFLCIFLSMLEEGRKEVVETTLCSNNFNKKYKIVKIIANNREMNASLNGRLFSIFASGVGGISGEMNHESKISVGWQHNKSIFITDIPIKIIRLSESDKNEDTIKFIFKADFLSLKTIDSDFDISNIPSFVNENKLKMVDISVCKEVLNKMFLSSAK
ncbi:MAG: hypothetical protein A2163_00845 [Actinobacteria bacterium RBG_13_35_12]|nr:MAG: hypothetical protein A2163_00845 [Actinobacteria bacterium RBG_13_35_12]